jgi:hypothetical protein
MGLGGPVRWGIAGAEAVSWPNLREDFMRSLPTALIGRTVVTLIYVIALAVVGDPGWPAVLTGASLVAVWLAALVPSVRELGRDRAVLVPRR